MKRLIATAVLATLVTTPAFAQSHPGVPNEGVYLGAGLGSSKYSGDGLDWLKHTGASTSDSDTGYKFFIGYQFNPHFAVEASHVDFGTFTATDVYNGEPDNYKSSIDGFGFALIGRLPIDAGFNIFGKLGLIAWDESFQNDYTNSLGQRVSTTESFSSNDPFYGIGAEYVVNQVMMRLEYERYDLRDSGEDFDIDLISASIGYRF